MLIRSSRMFAVFTVAIAPSVASPPIPNGPQCPQCITPVSLVGPSTAFNDSIDADCDGIADAKEQALALRYAPVVTLDGGDANRPASVRWLLERLSLGSDEDSLAAGLQLVISDSYLRAGSHVASDWETYVHVYRSRDRQRLYLQYWFFYPYNDGLWFFNHEGDWEHVTVVLTDSGVPMGMYASRHEDNAPGEWRAWRDIRLVQGTHPQIVSAIGSHASYYEYEDMGWRERARGCDGSSDCTDVQWRTWEGGGLIPLGESHAPRQTFVMRYRRRWGISGGIPGTFAPPGPPGQPGWCIDGDALCTVANR